MKSTVTKVNPFYTLIRFTQGLLLPQFKCTNGITLLPDLLELTHAVYEEKVNL